MLLGHSCGGEEDLRGVEALRRSSYAQARDHSVVSRGNVRSPQGNLKTGKLNGKLTNGVVSSATIHTCILCASAPLRLRGQFLFSRCNSFPQAL